MNINKIFIKKYGSFEDITIDTNSPFQVIFGKNEAGKSTTLRAIKQAIDKIKSRGNSDFYKYDRKDARLGLEIEHRGKTLSFLRRNGVKNTILDPENNIIDENSLLPFLQGISPEFFSTIFGINHDMIREGSENLLFNNGDLNAILFESAGNYRNLNNIINQLIEKKERLYKTRGKNQVIPKIIHDIKALETSLKEKMLTVKEWKYFECHFLEIKKEKEDLEANVRNKLKGIKKLENIIKFRSTKDKISFLEKKFSESNINVVILKQELNEIVSLNNSLQYLEQDRNKNLIKTTNIKDIVSGISVDTNFLKYESEIKLITQNFKEFSNNKSKISKLIMENIDSTNIIERTTNALPESINKIDINSFNSSFFDMAKSISKEIFEHQQDISKNQIKVKILNQEISSLTIKVQKISDNNSLDISTTKQNRIKELLKHISALKAQKSNLDSNLEKLKSLLTKHFDLSDKNLDSIYKIDEEILLDFKKEFYALEKSLHLTNSQFENANIELESTKNKLVNLEKQAAIPTLKELKLLQNSRDEILNKIITKMDNKTISILDWKKFLTIQQQTDTFAENLYISASDSTKKQNLLEKIETIETEIIKLKNNIAILDKNVDNSNENWISFWKQHGIIPKKYDSMISWWNNFCLKYDEYKDLVSEYRILENNLEDSFKELHQVYSFSAKENLIISYEELLERQQLIKNNLELKTTFSDQIETKKNEVIELKLNISEKEELIRKSINNLCSKNEIYEDETKIEIFDNYEDIERIFLLNKEIIEKQKFQKMLEHEVDNYFSSIKFLQQNLDITIDLDQNIILDLMKKLETEKENFFKMKSLHSQIETLVLENKTITSDIINKTAKFNDFFSSKHIEIPQNFQQWQELIENNIEICNEIKKLNDEITKLKMNENDLTNDIFKQNLEDLLKEHENELQLLDDKRLKLNQEFGIAKNKFEEISNIKNEETRDIKLKIENLKADLHENSKNFLIYDILTKKLKQLMEDYRKENHSGLIKSISKYFKKLSNNRYEKIDLDFDKDDNPFLVAINQNNEKIFIKNLSDGTRDQMYLSIRLAGIDYIRAKGIVLPLILDDLLINFDDERTEIALKVLNEYSQNTQILYFTHHNNIADFTRDKLNAKVIDLK